ncbi:fungal-specific transcription factor domain-containing protein [Aspergillus pseudoustus]|uniref:Fungal-specific transcription factor domain-containing protein n=1 Tax=Aspergillus pseudoustus TaxID=1810923 RepID=A0ABR4L229_9EURO
MALVADRESGGRALTKTQRAAIACEYCREKKIRCDGAKPACSTCKARGRECRQYVVPRKPRPTNSRIRQLERENQRLRALSAETRPHEASSTGNVVRVGANGSTYSGGVRVPSAANVESQSLLLAHDYHHELPAKGTNHRLAEIPQTGQPGYHGPTSALYDETREFCERSSSPSPSNPSTEPHDDLLVAEAAKQRHMEMVNMRHGKLDFDGIDPELGMHLLSLYWTRHLHAGLIVYRPAFMRDMASNGVYFSKLLLNAMFYSVSKHSSRSEIQRNDDRDTRGWSFRQRFTELLRDEFDKSSIPTIQAMLIMASSLFTRGDERSTSWLYAGNAFNMIIDLGLHVEGRKSLSAEDREIRRRVFWASFLIDKLQCLYQGRQPCIRFADTDVPLRFSDDFEDYEAFDFASFLQISINKIISSRSIQILQRLCELSTIMDRIYSGIYAVKRRRSEPLEKISRDSAKLQAELKTWRSNLPKDLDFDASNHAALALLPHNLSMLALWNALVILLHRPLVSDTRLHSTDPERAHQALTLCSNAASEITALLQAYARSYDARSPPFVLSYTTYIAATIHVHVLAKYHNSAPDTGSGTAQALQVCLWSLECQALMYSTAEKAKRIIEGLIERMDIKRYLHHGLPDNSTIFSGLHQDSSAHIASEQVERQEPNVDFFDFDFESTEQSLPFEFFQTEDWIDFDSILHF